jgi:hypothetical protein
MRLNFCNNCLVFKMFQIIVIHQKIYIKSIFHFCLCNYIAPYLMNAKHFSIKISIFHNVKAPEEGLLASYAALIETYKIGYAIAQDAGTHKYQKKAI